MFVSGVFYCFIGWSVCVCFCVHPVSITRFPSFRTQTLENLSRYLWKKRFLSNPDPGENLVSGNLVMETGCSGGNAPSRQGEGSLRICTSTTLRYTRKQYFASSLVVQRWNKSTNDTTSQALVYFNVEIEVRHILRAPAFRGSPCCGGRGNIVGNDNNHNST